MTEKLKHYLYDNLKVSSQDIKSTIESFSAYLDAFDRDYKYNYKFLVSHIEDFENALQVHGIFKNQCSKIISELIGEQSINDEFAKILLLNDRLSCVIEFNNILTYPIKETPNSKSPWLINGTIERSKWEDILSNKSVEINMYIEFCYDDIHFSKRYYSVDIKKAKHIEYISEFFNDSYKSIIEAKLGTDSIDKLRILRHSINGEYTMKVVLDDTQSYYLSAQEPIDFFGNGSIRIENNSKLKLGQVIINGSGFDYSFSIKQFKKFEELKTEIERQIEDKVEVDLDE